jgi:hypothetical protein
MKLQKIDMPARSGNGGGKFLKLDIGESVTGVFRGEPHMFYQKWPRGGNKETSDVPKPGFDPRFKVNLVVHEDGKFVPKIFEYPVPVNNQMADIQDAYDITTIKCKISRVASGKGSIYMVLPMIKEPISAKAMKEIEAVPLYSLSGQSAPPQPGVAWGDDEDAGSEPEF